MWRPRHRRALVGGLVTSLLACGRPDAPTRAAAPAPVEVGPLGVSEKTCLKGQLHMHTANSGDSETPAGQALRWYEAHGFDFVVVTDHNFVTPPPPGGAAPLVVAAGVELTQNLEGCEPPPEPGLGCLLHVNARFVDPRRTGRFVFPPATSPLRRGRSRGRAARCRWRRRRGPTCARGCATGRGRWRGRSRSGASEVRGVVGRLGH